MTKEDQTSAAIVFIIFLALFCISAAIIDYYTVSDDELKRELIQLQIEQLKQNK